MINTILFKNMARALPLLLLMSCGLIQAGGNPFNDAAPANGTVRSQCTLAPQNGVQVATGTVRVYEMQDLSYVIRFENLSIPTFNNTFQVIAQGSSSANYQTPLRGGTGNQNYVVASKGILIAWNSVRVRDPAKASGVNDVALCNLIATP